MGFGIAVSSRPRDAKHGETLSALREQPRRGLQLGLCATRLYWPSYALLCSLNTSVSLTVSMVIEKSTHGHNLLRRTV